MEIIKRRCDICMTYGYPYSKYVCPDCGETMDSYIEDVDDDIDGGV